jgi:lipopolysaccharide biosynthesis protein
MPIHSLRLIAFYLPQYHPIPENDAWWGKGFTEWTNVSKATPLFPGHYQPHLPADLGFYDLRLADARQAQADLAAQHGLDGFCYYHYWFGGKRLLERPFNDVLASGKPKLPFCLCWANESWSRRWLGEAKDVLMRQSYSLDDDVNHARWLIGAFSDFRYIQVEGRPMFLVYRPTDLLDPQRTTDTWRSECVRSSRSSEHCRSS